MFSENNTTESFWLWNVGTVTIMKSKKNKTDVDWFEPGERQQKVRRTTSPVQLKSTKLAPQIQEFEVSEESALQKKSKTDLITEVIRLQTMQRDVAIQMGIYQSSKSGERVIELHFAANVIKLLTASQSFNL